MYLSVATEIVLARHTLSLSRAEWARMLRISAPAMHAIEHGDAWPAESTIRSYASLTERPPEALIYAQYVDRAYAYLFSDSSAATMLIDAAIIQISQLMSRLSELGSSIEPHHGRRGRALLVRWPDIPPESLRALITTPKRIDALLGSPLAAVAWRFAAEYILSRLSLTVVHGAETKPCGDDYALAAATVRTEGGYIIPSPRNRADLARLCFAEVTISAEEPGPGVAITLRGLDGTLYRCRTV